MKKRLLKKIQKSPKKKVLVFILVVITGLFILILLLPDFTSDNISYRKEDNQRLSSSPDFARERKVWQKIISKSTDLNVTYQNFVKSAEPLNPGIQHLLAHVIGELMFDKIGDKAITICDTSYTYGCYHGLATIAIAEKGLNEVKSLAKECATIAITRHSAPCSHGIGHGIMEFFGHRDDKLNEALSTCNLAYTERDNQQYFGCLSGVYMEFNHPINIDDTHVGMGVRPVHNNDLYYPCDFVEDRFRSACYHAMPQWWARADEGNYRKLGDLCEKVDNKDESRDSCYYGIGMIVAPESNFDANLTRERCETIHSTQGQIFCKEAAATLFFDQPNKEKKRDIICEDLSPKERGQCNESPGRI